MITTTCAAKASNTLNGHFENKLGIFGKLRQLETKSILTSPSWSRLVVSLVLAVVSVIVGVDVGRAESIRGSILIRESQVFIVPLPKDSTNGDSNVLTHRWYRPLKALTVSASFRLRAMLLDLTSGDFVVVSGSLTDIDGDQVPDDVTVDAIESVGLRELLGSWRDDKWQVLRFEDFHRMSLYRPSFITSRLSQFNLKSRDRRLAKFKDLRYTLAPENNGSFSIFLAENNRVQGQSGVWVGRLLVERTATTRTLHIEIFAPKTGVSSEILSLSPIP